MPDEEPLEPFDWDEHERQLTDQREEIEANVAAAEEAAQRVIEEIAEANAALAPDDDEPDAPEAPATIDAPAPSLDVPLAPASQETTPPEIPPMPPRLPAHVLGE